MHKALLAILVFLVLLPAAQACQRVDPGAPGTLIVWDEATGEEWIEEVQPVNVFGDCSLAILLAFDGARMAHSTHNGAAENEYVWLLDLATGEWTQHSSDRIGPPSDISLYMDWLLLARTSYEQFEGGGYTRHFEVQGVHIQTGVEIPLDPPVSEEGGSSFQLAGSMVGWMEGEGPDRKLLVYDVLEGRWVFNKVLDELDDSGGLSIQMMSTKAVVFDSRPGGGWVDLSTGDVHVLEHGIHPGVLVDVVLDGSRLLGRHLSEVNITAFDLHGGDLQVLTGAPTWMNLHAAHDGRVLLGTSMSYDKHLELVEQHPLPLTRESPHHDEESHGEEGLAQPTPVGSAALVLAMAAFAIVVRWSRNRP